MATTHDSENKTMATGESNSPALILSETELRRIYFLVRARIDDCRKVTPEFSNYENIHAIELECQCLNDKIAKQIQIAKAK